jgi:hypothetical protein
MPTTNEVASRRRALWVLALALLAAAVVFALFAASGKPVFGLAAGTLAAALVISVKDGLRTAAQRESTDERGQHLELRARSLSWVATTAVLAFAWGALYAERGFAAAEPYGYLLAVHVASHTAALAWLRWRT